MKKAMVLALATAALALASGVPIAADDTHCNGVLTGVHDNVVVPNGAHCELVGARVKGNVLVLPGGSLRSIASLIGETTTINGNVQGDHSRFVCLLFGTRVGGDFQVKGGDVGTTSGFDINSKVLGDARIEENAGHTFIDAAVVGGNVHVLKNTGSIEVEFNTVGGNVKIEDNTVAATFTGDPVGCGGPTVLGGGMSIFRNMLAGNLQVFKNTSAPTTTKQVVDNTVRGIIQCYENTPIFVGGPNVGRADPPPNQCTGTSF